jgi:hypothetical protein
MSPTGVSDTPVGYKATSAPRRSPKDTKPPTEVSDTPVGCKSAGPYPSAAPNASRLRVVPAWPWYDGFMRRRRLIVAAAVLSLAVGVAVWWNAGRMTADERLLVGRWRRKSDETVIVLRPDHSYTMFYTHAFTEVATKRDGWWRVEDDELLMDDEPSAFRRKLRPLLLRAGVDVVPADRTSLMEFAAIPDNSDRFIRDGSE